MAYWPINRLAPVLVISCTNGDPLSTAFSTSVSRASDTDTPSRTSAAACLRLAGVMRLSAPISSCVPQRPQLESSFIHPSMTVLVSLCGDSDGAVLAEHATNSRHATARDRTPLVEMCIPFTPEWINVPQVNWVARAYCPLESRRPAGSTLISDFFPAFCTWAS